MKTVDNQMKRMLKRYAPFKRKLTPMPESNERYVYVLNGLVINKMPKMFILVVPCDDKPIREFDLATLLRTLSQEFEGGGAGTCATAFKAEIYECKF